MEARLQGYRQLTDAYLLASHTAERACWRRSIEGCVLLPVTHCSAPRTRSYPIVLRLDGGIRRQELLLSAANIEADSDLSDL